jgi:hypothetical protein
MIELILSSLERVAGVQPPLTILILILVLLGDDLVLILTNLVGVFL